MCYSGERENASDSWVLLRAKLLLYYSKTSKSDLVADDTMADNDANSASISIILRCS